MLETTQKRVHNWQVNLDFTYPWGIVLPTNDANSVQRAYLLWRYKNMANVVYPTFRDACFALGFLQDDKEYVEAIKKQKIGVQVITWENFLLQY